MTKEQYELEEELQNIEKLYDNECQKEKDALCMSYVNKYKRFSINDIISTFNFDELICVDVIGYGYFQGVIDIIYKGYVVTKQSDATYSIEDRRMTFRDSLSELVENNNINYDDEYIKIRNEYIDKIDKLNQQYAEQLSEFKVGDVIKQNKDIIEVKKIYSVRDDMDYMDYIFYYGHKLKKVKGKYYYLKECMCIYDYIKGTIKKLNVDKIHEQ